MLVVILVLSASRYVVAQTDNRFDQVEVGWSDGAYLGVVVSTNLGLMLVPPPPNPSQNPPGIDLTIREALRWDSVSSAATVSDVVALSMASTAVFGPALVEGSFDRRVSSSTMVTLEALSTTLFFATMVKHLASRQRPDSLLGDAGEGNNAYAAFFSGHTALAFGAATILSVLSDQYSWLDDDTSWLVPTVSYLSASVVAYMRVAADRHWFTDVLVGAIVGSATSYLVYEIRTD